MRAHLGKGPRELRGHRALLDEVREVAADGQGCPRVQAHCCGGQRGCGRRQGPEHTNAGGTRALADHAQNTSVLKGQNMTLASEAHRHREQHRRSGGRRGLRMHQQAAGVPSRTSPAGQKDSLARRVCGCGCVSEAINSKASGARPNTLASKP